MIFIRGLLLLLCLSGLACASRSAPVTSDDPPVASGAAILIIQVVGGESDEGQIALALFDSAGTFKEREDPVASGFLPLQDGAATWEVEDLVPGVYAVAVYHDLNSNGELDRSTLGPPAEPYGFSNDARGTFGPPKFDKAAIELAPGERTITIRLR